MNEPNTYAAAGVDIDVEAKASRIMYEASRRTWANRAGKLGEVAAIFDDFSGLRGIEVGKLPAGTMANLDFDGTGTKIEFAERSGRFEGIGTDLIAMVAEDAARRGAEPVIAGTVLDVNTLGTDESRLPVIHAIGESLVRGAAAAGIAIVNGEIAQLSERVTGQTGRFGCIWNSGLLWFGLRERLIDGRAVRPGDALVGLREPGLRSNGISLVRRALAAAYGDDWLERDLAGRPLIDHALVPSTIYTKAIVDMTGGYDPARAPKAPIHAVAHISGGGVPEKLARILKPTGLGAVIDTPFAPSPLMLHCQQLTADAQAGGHKPKLGRITDREAYRTWCMGYGMVIATPDPDAVLKVARAHGHEAAVVGHVAPAGPAGPTIRIKNAGYFAAAEPWLEYH